MTFRYRFRIESTEPRPPGAPGYGFLAETGRQSVLQVKDGKAPTLKGPSALAAFETREGLDHQTGGLTFGWSPIALALSRVVRTNDHLSIEAAAPESDRWHVLHDGFVSRCGTSGSASENSINWGFTVFSEGIQKLFRQSIWNWQGAMAIGLKDSTLDQTPLAEFAALAAKATQPPHEVIRALVNLFLDPKLGCPLKIQGRPISDRFAFGEFTSSFQDKWPHMAQVILSTWTGDFWSWIQTMADPDLHELYWVYGDQGLNTLVHRPRPFPGMDDTAWKYLDKRFLGRNGAPGAISWNLSRSDESRANAFHWSSGGFSDASVSDQFKLAFGWWMDSIGRQRYGYAPRQVSTNLIDQRDLTDTIKRLLEHVARQDAPLHELLGGTFQYATPVLGIRPGCALEDWSSDQVVSGYITGVTHFGEWTNDGLQAGTEVSVSRAVPGVELKDYPKAVAGLVDLQWQGYHTGKGSLPAHEQAIESARTGNAPAAGSRSQAQVPFGREIATASSKHGVPNWLLTETLRRESALGRSALAYDPKHEATVNGLGIAQLSKTAVDDLAAHGYRKADGNPFTYADRLTDAAAIDAAAAYQKLCVGYVENAGCSRDNPLFWNWVASCYNAGPGKVRTAGQASNWGQGGLLGYGVDIHKGKPAFGGGR